MALGNALWPGANVRACRASARLAVGKAIAVLLQSIECRDVVRMCSTNASVVEATDPLRSCAADARQNIRKCAVESRPLRDGLRADAAMAGRELDYRVWRLS